MFLEVPSLTYHSPITIAYLTYGLQRIFDFFNCVTSRVPVHRSCAQSIFRPTITAANAPLPWRHRQGFVR
jgi:hypothetical protein